MKYTIAYYSIFVNTIGRTRNTSLPSLQYIDLYSRMGYVEYSNYISSEKSFEVIKNAMKYLPFRFKTVQADNGSEFSENLYINLQTLNIRFRHSRVRKPNDNAHVERLLELCKKKVYEKGYRVRKKLKSN